MVKNRVINRLLYLWTRRSNWAGSPAELRRAFEEGALLAEGIIPDNEVEQKRGQHFEIESKDWIGGTVDFSQRTLALSQNPSTPWYIKYYTNTQFSGFRYG
jgi:hypothetical protein